MFLRRCGSPHHQKSWWDTTYSVLNASIGFSFEARAAGSHTAASATSVNTMGTLTKTAGSHCFTP